MTAVILGYGSSAGVSGGGTTQTITLPTLTSGTDVVVVTFTTGAQTITGISDGTNTYAKLTSSTGAPGTTELWAALNVTASSIPVTLTATWSATAAFASLWAADVAFLVTSSLLDAHNTTTNTSTQMLATSLTSAAAQELQISAFVCGSVVQGLHAGGSSAGVIIYTTAAMHAIGFAVVLYDNPTTAGTVDLDQTGTTAYLIMQASLKTIAPTTYTQSPSVTPSGPGTIQFIAGSRTVGVLSPSSPYPVTTGQTWPLA